MSKIFFPPFALVAAFFASTTSAHAQSVRWEPDSGTFAFNQPNELRLIFEQCEPSGTVNPPAVTGLMFGSPNRSESSAFTFINGNASRSRTITLSYRVRPTERGTLIIPPFSVDTDKGRQRVSSASFDVTDPIVGSGLNLDDVATATFRVPKSPVWEGQVFDLNHVLSINRNRPFRVSNNLTWKNDPLVIETWSKPVETQVTRGSQPITLVTQSTRAIARSPGTIPIAPAEQDVIIATGQDIFGRPTGTNFTITTEPATLTVKPLPSPAPATFNGAVGKFTLDSKVVPATAAVGEPITWTLTLEGTGNWPDIAGLPARSVSNEFTPVTPGAKRVNEDGALFDASLTEDVILIPTKPGRYTLGPVAYTFFNPASGAYETLTTQPVTIQVSPSATDNSAHERPQPGSDNKTSSATPSPDGTASERREPAAVTAIPRDPLPPYGSSVAPLSRAALIIGLVSSVLVPLLVWLALALRRARVTDPSRPLREAHIRLTNTLGALSASGAETANLTPPLLQAWQADTAILWGLPQAVPTPAQFPDKDWSTLWAEADRTLYGAVPLPADWTSRATQALSARRVPSFSPLQLFHPRNLLPLVLLITAFAASPSVFADEPGEEPAQSEATAAYAKGNFAAAEKAWTASLKTTPTDWSAHHNLALALIQQNRPGEASGHALAAFVQHPRNPSVRWHLDYAFKAAGVTPAAIKPFLSDAPTAWLARLASPTQWQFVLVASAWLTALAISLGIYGAYQKRPRKGIVRSMVVISLLLAIAGGLSLHTYGPLADAHAVVVVTPTTLRSIPTELDTQKSSPLSPGVIAATDKPLLGWRRLVFPDGQTGWVRAETLVSLWESAADVPPPK